MVEIERAIRPLRVAEPERGVQRAGRRSVPIGRAARQVAVGVGVGVAGNLLVKRALPQQGRQRRVDVRAQLLALAAVERADDRGVVALSCEGVRDDPPADSAAPRVRRPEGGPVAGPRACVGSSRRGLECRAGRYVASQR